MHDYCPRTDALTPIAPLQLLAIRSNADQFFVSGKPRMIYQPYHLLLTEPHLVSQLLNRLRPRGVYVVPNIDPQLLVFFGVHSSDLA